MNRQIRKAVLMVLFCSIVLGLASGHLIPIMTTDAFGAVSANQYSQIMPEVKPYLPYVVPNASTGQAEIPDFNYFSWQSFIALNWPSVLDPQGRPARDNAYPNGKPDTNLQFGDAKGPRAWEGLKADFELFLTDGSVPSDWTSYDIKTPPCGKSIDKDLSVKLLPLIAKGESVLPGSVNQAMGGPLAAQRPILTDPITKKRVMSFARYEVKLNAPEYNETKNFKWYLRSGLPNYPKPPISFSFSNQPNPPAAGTYGALEIKAAWRQLTDDEAKSGRYYVVPAILVNPTTGQCNATPVPVGLVGFHIAQKAYPFSAWMWSTFEQVDNVPCTTGETAGYPKGKCDAPALGYSFSDGKTDPGPNGYSPISYATPFNPKTNYFRPTQVKRVREIRSDIIDINKYVWNLPGVKGTVWENYKLVANQWPTKSLDPNTKKLLPIVINNPRTSQDNYPVGSGSPFPSDGSQDTVANITMETYFQNTPPLFPNFGDSCIHCHYQQAQTDFSWVLADMAYPRSPGSVPKLKSTAKAPATNTTKK